MRTERTPSSRYTTAEVAARLLCSFAEARSILKAAGIPYTRCGNNLLWDAEAVERLLEALQKRKEGRQ